MTSQDLVDTLHIDYGRFNNPNSTLILFHPTFFFFLFFCMRFLISYKEGDLPGSMGLE